MTFNLDSFVVDLELETVTFDGGFTVKISEMLDHNNEPADSPEDVVTLVLVMPPDRLEIAIDLDDIDLEEVNPDFH